MMPVQKNDTFWEGKKGSCLHLGTGTLERSLYWRCNTKHKSHAVSSPGERREQCSRCEDQHVSQLCSGGRGWSWGSERMAGAVWCSTLWSLQTVTFISLRVVYWDSTCPSRPWWCLSHPMEHLCPLTPMPTSPFFDYCAHIIRSY